MAIIAEFLRSATVYLLEAVVQSSIFWLPVILIYILVWLYFYLIRTRYLSQLRPVLLEIKIPKEIYKTPQAMEIVFSSAFHQTWDGDNLLIGQWLKGQVRAWFSLELVSLGGEVHFFVWTSSFFKNIVEAQIYAQYPDVEIFEVADYAEYVPYGLPGTNWKLWGCEFKLEKEDAYPIKTYVDYGLDRPDREEEGKSDPLTAALEFLGSINPEEQVWIQILVQASKPRFRKPNTWFKKEGWKDEGKRLVVKLMKRDRKPMVEAGEISPLTVLSPGERTTLERVERNLAKLGFDCGIRAIYLAPEDKFNQFNVPGLIGSLRQFNSVDANGFKVKLRTSFNYPWQDPFGRRLAKRKAVLFDAYRRRSYFYPPYERTPFVLASEELATIYHFPGRVAATPTFSKIESKRGEPPVNLPV